MTEWEKYKLSSFSRIQTVVSQNVGASTLKRQLVENKHITALYLSQLAYFSFDKIRAKMVEFGATDISLYDKNGTQGFCAELDDIVIVSFRGTELNKTQDIKNVLTFWKIPFNGLDVHKGFIRSLAKLIPNVVADLQQVSPDKRVVYTGHSLGGALACLLSIAHKPDEICTFGAPRVAGKDIANHFEGVEYNRIVTTKDWVRMLPPNIPGIISYAHGGTEHILESTWDWKNFTRPHLLVTYLNALLAQEEFKNV